MFDYTCNNNYTMLPEEKQVTNEKNLHTENLRTLYETKTGYKLLAGIASLQKNQRRFAIVYLQTPQGELYMQEQIPMSSLKTRKGVLDFIYDLPDEFSRLGEKDVEIIKTQLIQILQDSNVSPVCMGAEESPQGVYEEVVAAINRHSEKIESNPFAPVFKRENVGYIRTTHFTEFIKELKLGYNRKEVLGMLKLSDKLIVDKDRAYDKRLHFGAVNGKYYAVKLPESIEEDTTEKIEIVLPQLDERVLEKVQTEGKNNVSKITLCGYYGGKNRICDRLNNLMPQSKIFIEPFIGSGATILNRDRSEVEIVNDFDPAVANLYKVMADKEMGKELLEKMFQLPYDEKLFKMAIEYQRENFKGINDIDKALLTFVLVGQSYNNSRRQFSRGGYNTELYQKKIRNNITRVYERLQGVQVYNKNALEIIKAVADNPDAQIYMDPPYLHSLRGEGADKVYFKEMGYIEHVRMLELIQDAKCRILLSGYHAEGNDLYDTYLLPYGWKSRELVKVIKSSQRQKERDIAAEWVWSNYNIPSERGLE